MSKYPFLSKLAFALLFIVFGYLFMVEASAQEETPEGAEEEIEIQSVEQELILFVEEGCPYCDLVKEFMSENLLEDKIDVRDVRADPENAALYEELFEKAGVPIQERGSVPVLFDAEDHFDGASEIITHLGEKFGIEVDDFLPNNDDTENGEDENSRSMQVVLSILGVGVVISIGYLIISKRQEK